MLSAWQIPIFYGKQVHFDNKTWMPCRGRCKLLALNSNFLWAETKIASSRKMKSEGIGKEQKSNASVQFSSVQSLSHVRLLATPWIEAHQASLSITNSWSSLRLTSIESVMPSSHLILCHPFSSCPQSLPASESFPMSQLFAWGAQSTGVSALELFLPKI